MNWYRLNEINTEDESKLGDVEPINVPTLWVGATKDKATPASMGKTQYKYIPDLTSHELPTSHWVMDDMPEECKCSAVRYCKS